RIPAVLPLKACRCLAIRPAGVDQDFGPVQDFGGFRDLEEKRFACFEIEHAAGPRPHELVRMDDFDVGRSHASPTTRGNPLAGTRVTLLDLRPIALLPATAVQPGGSPRT